MNQDNIPIGPSSSSIETEDAVPDRTNPWKKSLLIGCGGCALILALAAVFGGWIVMRFGFGVFADEVEADLRSNPVVREHLGRIEQFELDLSASIAAEGEEDFVFRVSGTRGSGLIVATCVTNESGVEEVVSGTIQLESGETVDLFPEASESEPG